MEFEILETRRLWLQKLSPEIMTRIFKENSEEKIREILGLHHPEHFERQIKIYEKGYESYNRTMLNFQLVEKETQRIIGNCGYHTWNPQHCRAEIGYEIFDEQFKKQGYMSEALKPILEFGFKEMNLNRIEAIIDPANTPSLRLLENNGFVREGTLRGHYLIGETFEDSDLYSLLKKDFSTKNLMTGIRF
ncbi:GNAT family N-acetyltransferase [Chryseobacterium sp. MFBS3-17]|uniref:GNAT family N-acetyltransferase n=1 Tax=Chryseobacterium sp. MFBS3-17 TaxID=2886689 RepID=UPI001D0EE21C|nr:GNAT family protein [Chryseobacterium sp. MFBS3-17]MCC2589603.1 GNAT family N-acetyltransferase [Chryseobacterium sp. MFBS3-17]